MESNTIEFAQLKQEIADLRQRVKELERVINITPADPARGTAKEVLIVCSGLELFHQEGTEKNWQARFLATKEGPRISLRDKEENSRFTLGLEGGAAHCEFLDKDMNQLVVIGEGEAGGIGQVGVCEAGRPRAVMKANAEGGVVSVVHDDGKARALLASGATGGEVVLFHKEGNAVVKLSSEPEKGGIMAISAPDGQPLVSLTPGNHGGSVLVFRKEGGELGCSMTTMEEGAAISVSAAPGKARATLLVGGGGPHLMLSNTEGVTVADLGTVSNRGSLMLNDERGKHGISMFQPDQGPLVTLESNDGKTPVKLPAFDGEGALELRCGETAFAALSTKKAGSSLGMVDVQGKISLYAGNTAGKPAIHLQSSDAENENAAVTLFVQEDGGAVMVSGADGARRAGICAAKDGGQVVVYNDLGIERAVLASADDGGALRLNWGGTMGVAALAAQDGGAVIVNDEHGRPRGSLPPTEHDDE